MGVASGCGEQEVGVVVRRYRIAGNFRTVQIFAYFT